MIKVETDKIAKEMLNILAKNRVPVIALENILEHLKELAYTNTQIQDTENEFEEDN
jgi:hypothetical protein